MARETRASGEERGKTVMGEGEEDAIVVVGGGPPRSSTSCSSSTLSGVRYCALSSGMIVSASTSDTSTAIVSVIDSEWKNCPSTPVNKPSGRNTTTVVIVDVVTGQMSSCTASRTATERLGFT